ncbi:sulfate adenylyltransferase [bacterium]|nr:sulfate adenylyltransferase [bacterium]
MTTATIPINRNQYLELEKISFGAFAPVSGFMTEREFHSVVNEMRLPDGQPFPLPIVLDLAEEQAAEARRAGMIRLVFQNRPVGEVHTESVYRCDKLDVAERVFGTTDVRHPGVAAFMSAGNFFVGGKARLLERVEFEFSEYELTPEETRARFRELGWKTVAGFQTRNIPHRAHEYLQRLALEQVDGLFIQPLVGQKKRGDFAPHAILAAYRTLVDQFLPAQRVLLGVLSTFMRYAGPREAVFHAIIRKNYGCTHFIVGRDHAGVGSYYGKYDAHELTKHFEPELGIRIFRFAGPFYCSRCDGIATERTCPHAGLNSGTIQDISGTDLRAILSNGRQIPPEIMRPEVLASIRDFDLFITQEE